MSPCRALRVSGTATRAELVSSVHVGQRSVERYCWVAFTRITSPINPVRISIERRVAVATPRKQHSVSG